MNRTIQCRAKTITYICYDKCDVRCDLPCQCNVQLNVLIIHIVWFICSVQVRTDDEVSYHRSKCKLYDIPADVSGIDFWLGGYDLVNEGTWVWVKKNEYINDYTHWAPGEPSSGTSENCLGLYDGLNYQWNDAPCTLEEAFICEVP